MIRYPLVLFDLDGTLVDSFADIAAGIRAACAAIGVAAEDALVAMARRGAPLEDFYRVAAGADPALPSERARYERFVDAYRGHYLPGCTRNTAPYPGVVDALRALRALSPRPILGVATTKRTETAERVLSGTGLLALLDVFSGTEGMPPKPDPAVLHKVAGLAGLDVRYGVMVGDTDRDVLAARAAGCAAAAVTYGGFAAAELAALGPDHLLGSLGELVAIVAGCR